MAADRQRLAQALAAEAARRKMFESIPEAAGQGLPQAPERPMGWNDYLENLSIGLGRGAVSNLEGIKGMVTSPVETLKGVATGVTEAVRNPRMVAEALKQTGQRAMSGPLGLGEVIGENVNMMRVSGKPVMHELDVYHGTPHRFPATEANPLGEFDASKIGTGEGAQAYGHGIYLAESPGVAESYKQMSPQMLPVSKYAPDEESAYYAARVVRQMGSPEKAIEKLAGTGKSQEFVKAIKDGSYKRFYDELPQASLYKADLPDEMIGRMLDWDAPLSEQPAAIKNLFPTLEEAKAIEAEMIRLSEATLAANDINGPAQAAWEAMYKSPQYKMAKIVVDEADPKLGKKFANGQKIYRAISGGDDKASAEQLRAFGIPGIKYLDAGSRGQGGTGTRNFVVFPGEEKKVRILERDGQKAPPQKIAQALEAASSKTVKAEPQPFGVQGYLNDDLRRVKQNFFSQYGVEENKQFSKDYEVVELAKLKPSENINESKIQSLMKTMREEGNARDNPIPPIIVDSEGNILDGHHRYEAAKRLGAKYVPIVELFDKRKGPVFLE